jgi:NAD(P)-dependent dehydrogenase (short-subunit alcohol dehydrogenase family)
MLKINSSNFEGWHFMKSYIIFGANSDIASNLIEQLSINNKVYAIARSFHTHTYSGKNIEIIETNFSDFNLVENLVAELSKKDENIIGVANFSGSIFIKPSHLTSESDYEKVMESNFKTSFAINRAVGKSLSNCSILYISTTATMVGLANHDLISASNAAINGMVISSAASYAHKNLRFNAIAPGLVETKLAKPLIGNDSSRKISESINPLSKIGRSTDIANLAYFLLNPDNSWITGQIIAVDGGMSIVRPRVKN